VRAKNKRSRTTKGWSKLAPKTAREREALYARCGAKAFLDPKNLKFPVMAKRGPCVVDCAGIRAAKSRAGQYKHRKVKAQATRMGERAACTWAPGAFGARKRPWISTWPVK
jgi:hypothetical protein